MPDSVVPSCALAAFVSWLGWKSREHLGLVRTPCKGITDSEQIRLAISLDRKEQVIGDITFALQESMLVRR